MAEHGGPLAGLASAAVVVGALLAALAYLAGVLGSRRGWGGSRRGWSSGRTACWLAGLVAVLVASTGPLAEAGHTDFTAHAVGHVLLGMLGPLLLVCGAPVTLALRALPVAAARRLSRLLSRRPVRLATEPVVAALLDVGGLALLYLTPLYARMHTSPALHALVHLHLLVAGALLAVAVAGPDPAPHRRSHRHRAVVLVAAVAGHDLLAKYLYLHPPAGVAAGAAETGAMVMYYGGDAVEVALMVLLCRSWFASTTSRRARQPRLPVEPGVRVPRPG